MKSFASKGFKPPRFWRGGWGACPPLAGEVLKRKGLSYLVGQQ
jgi:hypothetical protein